MPVTVRCPGDFAEDFPDADTITLDDATGRLGVHRSGETVGLFNADQWQYAIRLPEPDGAVAWEPLLDRLRQIVKTWTPYPGSPAFGLIEALRQLVDEPANAAAEADDRREWHARYCPNCPAPSTWCKCTPAAEREATNAAAEPDPPLLRPGTLVRIPGMEVPYVVDKGLSTSGPRATLTFTTVDGCDWDEPRMGTSPEPDSVNAAAEPKDPTLFEGGLRAAAERLSWPVSPGPAEAVLSETTEPYVSVNLSVTSDNSGEVVKVIRKLVREGRLCAGALA